MRLPHESEDGLLLRLQQSALCRELEQDDLRTVLELGRVVDATAGTELAREGVAQSDFYLLLDGELIVSVGSGEGLAPLEVGVLRPGASFGELGALLGERRTASVIAAVPSRLLHLDAPALQALFARCPRFGWAFSRELARGLRAALASKNELQAEASPETVVLDVPAVEHLRGYLPTYYATALRTMLRQHRLIVDRQFPFYEAPLRIGDEERARWQALFGVDRAAACPPFTFHTTVGTLVLMKVVADVGVNFRNLLHLRSEMAMAPQELRPGTDYRLRSRLSDILALRGDRVALVVDSRVLDADGHPLRLYRDFFVILHLEPHHVQALRASKGFGHIDASPLRDLARRRSRLAAAADVRRAAVDIADDLGARYGRISGDLNPVHTTALAARVFGHGRPFVQGLCTANLVIAALAGAPMAPLQRLGIAFVQPVHTGQRVEVVWSDSQFEVLDAKAAVLACGSYERASGG